MATAPPPSAPDLYGATSDAGLQQLIAQLSAGVTPEEMRAVGLNQKYGKPNTPGMTDPYTPHATGQMFHQDFGGGGGAHKQDWYGRIAHASPSAAIYHGLRQSGHRSAERARSRAFYNAEGQASQDYLTQRAASLEAAKRELHQRETKNQINQSFRSETMGGLYDTLRSNVLQNSLADIVDKYQTQLKQSAFQTAGQGLTGSTVDAERRGGLDKAQTGEAVQAAGSADTYVRNLQNQGETQRRSLIDTLSSDNPADAASLEQTTRGVQGDVQRISDQYAQQAAQRQISQGGLNMQSQALGNLLSNYANLYSTGQNAQGYGGGSAF